jgi:hypothetical protein
LQSRNEWNAVLKINRAPKIDIGKNTFQSVKTYCECYIKWRTQLTATELLLYIRVRGALSVTNMRFGTQIDVYHRAVLCVFAGRDVSKSHRYNTGNANCTYLYVCIICVISYITFYAAHSEGILDDVRYNNIIWITSRHNEQYYLCCRQVKLYLYKNFIRTFYWLNRCAKWR